MTRHNDYVRVRHMLDHALEAQEMAKNRTRTDLDNDRQFNLALLKVVEIIGEAAYSTSEQVREKYPEIPWQKIISSRHHLVHGYDQIENRILWDIIVYDIAPLIKQLENILEEDV